MMMQYQDRGAHWFGHDLTSKDPFVERLRFVPDDDVTAVIEAEVTPAIVRDDPYDDGLPVIRYAG